MTAQEILQKHEDANEMHLHHIDRKWVFEAMEEYASIYKSAKKQITEILDDLDYRYDLLTGDADWLMNEIRSRLENVTDQVTDVGKMVEKSEKPIIPEISDEEIEVKAKQTYREHPNNPKEYAHWNYGKDINFARKQKAFIKGAQWYREQLKKKNNGAI